MNWDEPGFDHSSFTRNRERLLAHDVAGEFFRTVVEQERALKLTSDEHFTVDGTLIEAWASLKSLRPKGDNRNDRTPSDDPGNPSVDFHGERRQNATHESTTDPKARLAKKGAGKEAELCFTESVLMENRNGIMVDLRVGCASGPAECEQGLRSGDAETGAGTSPDHGCGGQRLRSGGIRGWLPRAQCHSARGAERTAAGRFRA